MIGRRLSAGLVGLCCGVGANLLWGLAFLVPVLLPTSASVEITLGRYLFYGVVSVVILAFTRGFSLRDGGWRVWLTAMIFAVTGNVGYYFFLVQGVSHVGAPATTVVIGTLPVTVALYGNWRRRELPFAGLLLPLGLILVGLLLVNLIEIGSRGGDVRGSLPQQLLGIAAALTALAMWTWFGVANAGFLKSHREISPSAWSTLVGVNTLVLVLLALPVVVFTGNLSQAGGGTDSGNLALRLVLGSLVLGVLVSWGGTLLWNRASELLPVSVVGQLIVFETISGLSYVFLARSRLPAPLEVLGIAMLVAGVLIGIRRIRAPRDGIETSPAPVAQSVASSLRET